MTNFQKNWLRVAGVIAGLFGVLIALFAFPATEAPMRIFFELLGKPLPAEPGDHFRFAMGLMGFISLGWSLTLIVACEAGHALTGPAATRLWRGLAWAVAIWFVTDGIASIYTGYWRNILPNSGLAVMLLVPMLASGVLKRG